MQCGPIRGPNGDAGPILGRFGLSGPVKDRFGPVWAVLRRSEPVWAVWAGSGPVWAGSGPVWRSGPVQLSEPIPAELTQRGIAGLLKTGLGAESTQRDSAVFSLFAARVSAAALWRSGFRRRRLGDQAARKGSLKA